MGKLKEWLNTFKLVFHEERGEKSNLSKKKK
jgi:hypothetical protein